MHWSYRPLMKDGRPVLYCRSCGFSRPPMFEKWGRKTYRVFCANCDWFLGELERWQKISAVDERNAPVMNKRGKIIKKGRGRGLYGDFPRAIAEKLMGGSA